MLGYVKDNFNTRFDTHSYHCYREMHYFMQIDSDTEIKRRSMSPIDSMCLKRTLYIEGLTYIAIILTEECSIPHRLMSKSLKREK